MRARGKNRIIHYSGVFAASLLVTLAAVYFYSPTAGTHADTVNMGVEVGSVISMSLDKSSLALGGNPGQFTSGNIAATISTNSAFGYTLAIEDADNNTSLTSETSEDAFTSTFSGNRTEETMENNTWGFSIDAENFYKIPVKNSPVIVKRVQSHIDGDSDSSTVTIGAKIGQSITSGLYTDRLLLSAYANGVDGDPEGVDPSSRMPEEIGSDGDPSEDFDPENPNVCITNKTIYDISTMQRMSSCICANTTTPTIQATEIAWEPTSDTSKVPRVVLKDRRDNSKYLVSKLADGNCWMSQNLDLDLVAGEALTNKTTDLNSKASWTPSLSTETTIETLWTASEPYSYKRPDSGLYLKQGYVNSSTPTENSDEYLWEKVGKHYNWIAATAGSGSLVNNANTNAQDSICPKGWMLPAWNGEKSYSNLLGRSFYYYNYQSLSGRWTTSPLNYVVAGYRQTSNVANLLNYGEIGLLWSSTLSNDTSKASHTSFNRNSSSLTTSTNYKNQGMNIRCVAR